MNIQAEAFDFNQTGLLFLAVSALCVARERRLLPFLIVVFGSLIHDWFCVFFLAGLLLIDRFRTRRSKWLLLSDSIGLAALIAASALSGVYQIVFLIYGLLLLSIHLRRGGLGVAVPLLLVHQFFPTSAPLEVVLSAAGLYVLLEEVLRLAKSSQIENILAWVEVPVVLAIIFPFKDDVVKLIDSPEALASLTGLVVVTGVIGAVLSGRRTTFEQWAQGGYHRGAVLYRALNRSFSERQAWIQPQKSVAPGTDRDFNFFFWSAVGAFALWGILIALTQGRVG